MIIDHCRDKEEFEKFFYDYQMPKDNQFSLEWVLNNPHLYCFYGEKDNKLKAYIVMHEDKDGKVYLSGASCRKNFLENKKGIIKVCNAFPCDIYSHTEVKHARVMLKFAGFKQISETEFIYKKDI